MRLLIAITMGVFFTATSIYLPTREVFGQQEQEGNNDNNNDNDNDNDNDDRNLPLPEIPESVPMEPEDISKSTEIDSSPANSDNISVAADSRLPPSGAIPDILNGNEQSTNDPEISMPLPPTPTDVGEQSVAASELIYPPLPKLPIDLSFEQFMAKLPLMKAEHPLSPLIIESPKDTYEWYVKNNIMPEYEREPSNNARENVSASSSSSAVGEPGAAMAEQTIELERQEAEFYAANPELVAKYGNLSPRSRQGSPPSK